MSEVQRYTWRELNAAIGAEVYVLAEDYERLETQCQRTVDVLADLVRLAEASMRESDGGYDIDGELADAMAILAEYQEGETPPGFPSRQDYLDWMDNRAGEGE